MRTATSSSTDRFVEHAGARAVVVSGASSGIGYATALRLARDGFRVYAGVRNDQDARRLPERHARLVPVHLDVTDATSIAEVAARAEREADAAPLVALVNSAGIGIGGPLEVLDEAALRTQFDVNVFGALALTQRLLPLLVAGGRGRVVVIGSASHHVPVPFLGPYSASKAALAAFTATLRIELASRGVAVSLVEPGVVNTRIFDKARTQGAAARAALSGDALRAYGARIDDVMALLARIGEKGIAPERVADVIARVLAARAPKARYVVGKDAAFAVAAEKLLTRGMLEALSARAFARRRANTL